MSHPNVDIEKLLKEEADSSRESGWKIVSKSDLVEVWSKSEESQSVHLVKVRSRTMPARVTNEQTVLHSIDQNKTEYLSVQDVKSII